MQDGVSLIDCSQIGVGDNGGDADNCWAEINLSALGRNAHLLQCFGTPLMAVLKANAYGHGMQLVAPELLRQGIKHFGVATPQEGAQLRGIVGAEPDVFVMSPAPPEDAAIFVRERLIAFASSREFLAAMSAAAQAVGSEAVIHLEVDTGIGRAGFEPSEFGAALRHAMELPGIRLTGICTHFTWGENAEDARGQYDLFEKLLRAQVPSEVLETLVIHAANSPGFLNVPEARQSLIRPGLLLYGIAPEGASAAKLPGGGTLEPVLALRARVLLVRDLPAGAPISYGRTYVLPHPARIATIGIGYGDGYSRQFSNRGRVLLPDGQTAPVRGRVCMDQLCIELPQRSMLAAGDTVTLVGEAGGGQLRAAEIAGSIDATPHEITTCLTRRVPRIPIRERK